MKNIELINQLDYFKNCKLKLENSCISITDDDVYLRGRCDLYFSKIGVFEVTSLLNIIKDHIVEERMSEKALIGIDTKYQGFKVYYELIRIIKEGDEIYFLIRKHEN